MSRLIRHHTRKTPDGAIIDIQEMGHTARIPLVIVNGLGGNLYAWQNVLDDLAKRYHIISWDYRGLFRSHSVPIEQETVFHHARDMDFVLNALQVEKAAIVSWSFGTQVALAFLDKQPERAFVHVSVCGSLENPFDSEFKSNALAKLLHFAAPRDQFLRMAITVLRDKPSIMRMAQRLGLVSKTLDKDVFLAWIDSFADIKLELFFAAIDAMRDFYPEQYLSRQKIPMLFISGGQDKVITPEVVAKAEANYHGPSELLTIPLATHYLPLEFSSYLCLKLDDFFARHIPHAIRSGTEEL